MCGICQGMGNECNISLTMRSALAEIARRQGGFNDVRYDVRTGLVTTILSPHSNTVNALLRRGLVKHEGFYSHGGIPIQVTDKGRAVMGGE